MTEAAAFMTSVYPQSSGIVNVKTTVLKMEEKKTYIHS